MILFLLLAGLVTGLSTTADASCVAAWGNLPGFELCAEDEAGQTCRFALETTLSCDEVCANEGETCISAERTQKAIYGACTKRGGLSCGSAAYGNDRVCTCTRPSGPATPEFQIPIRASWTPTTTNTDGTPLTDLAGFTLYLCDAPIAGPPAACDGELLTVTINDPGVTATDALYVTTKQSGSVHAILIAWDTSGNQSEHSNQEMVSFEIVLPSPPDLLPLKFEFRPGDQVGCESGWLLDTQNQVAVCQ